MSLQTSGMRIHLVLASLFLFGVASGGSFAAVQPVKRVFVLNSFNRGYVWTDNMLRGIDDTFAGSAPGVETYVSFMDMKRVPSSPQYFAQFKELIREGYKGVRFDAVLACDNDALEFLREYRDELFPGVPVVFVSINDFDGRMLDGRRDITGTSENTDYEGTIRCALKLRPATKHIVVVTDATTTGKAHRSAVEKIRGRFPQQLTFVYLSLADMTLDDLGLELSKLPSDSVVLLLHHFVDRDGATYTVAQSTPLLTRRSTVPVFVLSDIRIGLGSLGGHVVSGYHHGEAAAKMVKRILSGTPVESIPVLLDSPNQYMFDRRVMDRFGVAESRLPPGSILVNRPVSVLQMYREELLVALCVFILLCIFLVYLLLEVRRRRRSEAALRQSQFLMRAVAEGTSDAVYVKDLQGRYLLLNRAGARFVGKPVEDALGRDDAALFPPDEARHVMDGDRRVMASGVTQTYEEPVSIGGAVHTFLATKGPVRDEQNRVVGLFGISRDITGIKETQDQLRASGDRYRTLFDRAGEGVMLMSLEGKLLKVNGAFARMHGYSVEEMERMSLKDLDTPDTYQTAGERVARIQAGEKLTFEVEHYHKDGHVFPLEVSVSLIESGEDTYLQCFHREITERKKAEHSLREIEAQFRAFFEQAGVGVSILETPTGRFVRVNRKYCDIVGYSPEEMQRGTFQDLTFPDDLAADLANMERLRKGAISQFSLEKRYFHKSGRVVWVNLTVTPLWQSGEPPAFHMAVVEDITERKRSEAVMRVHVDLLHYSANHPLDEVLQRTLDEVGRLTDSPIGFYHFVGDDQMTLTLKAWSTRTEKEFCAAAGKGSHYSVDQAGVWADCVRQRRPVIHNDYASLPHRKGLPPGHAAVMRELAVPIFRCDRVVAILGVGNKPGEYVDADVRVVTHLASVAWEVAERKRVEEESAKVQIQLTQAQKMESVGRLAGGVAHDFNNLLMGIMNYVDLCRDELAEGHPIRGYLDEITSDAQRSADLARQLLAFARKQTVMPKVLDLNDTVVGMLKMLERLLGENISMTWIPGARLWQVKVDPSQVDQILANLCINARDAIAGVGRLTIETSNVAADERYCAGHAGAVPGEYVQLALSDTGHGMGQDVIEHIFEPFFTTKDVGKGTGLGLATVYGIVVQNKGFITVYSEPGKGTTFKICLPRCDAQPSSCVAAEPYVLPRGSETILLVEDEKSVRVTTHMFLENLGYKVLVADDPGKALGLAAQHSGDIDLLITDVIMPNMSGRDLADQLSGTRPFTRRIFISGFTADVIAQEGVLEDGVQFLSKPFGREALARKVREVLEGKPGAGSPLR
jgi:two-component system cell cycle sensor histidine kinase/response regulator CckA